MVPKPTTNSSAENDANKNGEQPHQARQANSKVKLDVNSQQTTVNNRTIVKLLRLFARAPVSLTFFDLAWFVRPSMQDGQLDPTTPKMPFIGLIVGLEGPIAHPGFATFSSVGRSSAVCKLVCFCYLGGSGFRVSGLGPQIRLYL